MRTTLPRTNVGSATAPAVEIATTFSCSCINIPLLPFATAKSQISSLRQRHLACLSLHPQAYESRLPALTFCCSEAPHRRRPPGQPKSVAESVQPRPLRDTGRTLACILAESSHTPDTGFASKRMRLRRRMPRFATLTNAKLLASNDIGPPSAHATSGNRGAELTRSGGIRVALGQVAECEEERIEPHLPRSSVVVS